MAMHHHKTLFPQDLTLYRLLKILRRDKKEEAGVMVKKCVQVRGSSNYVSHLGSLGECFLTIVVYTNYHLSPFQL